MSRWLVVGDENRWVNGMLIRSVIGDLLNSFHFFSFLFVLTEIDIGKGCLGLILVGYEEAYRKKKYGVV